MKMENEKCKQSLNGIEVENGEGEKGNFHVFSYLLFGTDSKEICINDTQMAEADSFGVSFNRFCHFSFSQTVEIYKQIVKFTSSIKL
jgi:hypothetical protein